MLKLFNCIFLFLGINQINIDNFTDMKIIFDDYDDVKKKIIRFVIKYLFH